MQDVSQIHSGWDDFFVYNPASRHRRRILFSLLRRFGIKPMTVLDVGCGDGRFLEELQARLGCDISGIELGETSAQERLRGRLRELHRVDIQDATAPGRYDLIICSEVLEHLHREADAARNLAAMCSGHLFVTVPGRLRGTDVPMGHLRAYTKQSLLRLLEAAGFETLACFRWGFPFHQLYRFALDLFPGAVLSGFGKTGYGPVQKLACLALYWLFYWSVPGMGEQLFYVGRMRKG